MPTKWSAGFTIESKFASKIIKFKKIEKNSGVPLNVGLDKKVFWKMFPNSDKWMKKRVWTCLLIQAFQFIVVVVVVVVFQAWHESKFQTGRMLACLIEKPFLLFAFLYWNNYLFASVRFTYLPTLLRINSFYQMARRSQIWENERTPSIETRVRFRKKENCLFLEKGVM